MEAEPQLTPVRPTIQREEAKAVYDDYDAVDIKYKDLLGKRIILTGGSSGIGRQVAKKLLRSGATVILLGRNPRALEQVTSDIKSKGIARIYQCDIERPVQLEETFVKIMEEFEGNLDGLINTVGTSFCADFRDTTLKEWDLIMNINVRAPMQLMSLITPFLKETHGAIVNVSAAPIPRPKNCLFSVSKACLDMVTKCASLELAPSGVRVNAVAPGFVNTPMRMNQRIAPISQAENEAVMREAARITPMMRLPLDKEVADAIVWLVSDSSSFVNGQIITVDGGASIATSGSDISWHKSKGQVTLTQNRARPPASTDKGGGFLGLGRLF